MRSLDLATQPLRAKIKSKQCEILFAAGFGGSLNLKRDILVIGQNTTAADVGDTHCTKCSA